MCASLSRDLGDRVVLCGDPYLVMPASRKGYASVRGDCAEKAGAVMGVRVFDAA